MISALVFEDDVLILKDMLARLRHLGCRALGSRYITGGKAKIKRLHPDVIFLDFMFEDGHTGAELVKEIAGECDTRIVFVSAYKKDEIKKNLEAAWIKYSYISKPFANEDLEKAICTIKEH